MLSDFKIICLSETHLDENIDTNDFLIPGFDRPQRRDCSRSSGGLLVYTANDIISKRRIDLETLPD